QVNWQYPSFGDRATTLTPQLLANAHDADAFPKSLKYKFSVYEELPAVPPAEQGAQQLVGESGWIDSRTWTVPSGKLKWGKTYRWAVQVYDGHLYSTAAPSGLRNVLLTPVPQGPVL